jgi:predicted patatin/cPLA2 family phospholipase
MKLVRDIQLNQTTPISGLGLVAEGGGQRGAFTAGVLDYLQIANFNPFEIIIGTSAGAQNVASFVSQQKGYAYSLIHDLTRDERFFNPWRFFSKNNIMDLDWYFKQVKKKSYQFDSAQANKNAQNRKVRFTAAHSSRLTTKLVNPVKDGWLNSLRYSSSIPYLYDSGDFLDGGVSAPIPVTKAYKLGAKKIVVIRTTDGSETIIPKPIERIKPLLCPKNRCPRFIKILYKYENGYKRAERFIKKPPSDVEIITLRPLRPLATKVLGSSEQNIVDDYKYGLEIGKSFIENQANSLLYNQQAPLDCS